MHQFRTTLFFLLHAAVIVFVYTSPLLVSWSTIIWLIALYYVQLILIGCCVLTMLEFGTLTPPSSFHHHYLERLGITISQQRLSFILDFIIPWIILSLAIIWQESLGHTPLLGF